MAAPRRWRGQRVRAPTLNHPPIDVLAPNGTPSSSTDRAMLRSRAVARLSLFRMLLRKEEL